MWRTAGEGEEEEEDTEGKLLEQMIILYLAMVGNVKEHYEMKKRVFRCLVFKKLFIRNLAFKGLVFKDIFRLKTKFKTKVTNISYSFQIFNVIIHTFICCYCLFPSYVKLILLKYKKVYQIYIL